MRKYLLFYIIIVVFCVCPALSFAEATFTENQGTSSLLAEMSYSTSSFAKKKTKKSKKKRSTQRTNFVLEKTSGKTYVFGFSQVLGDSVTYITFINEVDSIDVQKRTKFLPFRSDFSMQLKVYLEAKCGLSRQTCCVFYSSDRNKLLKKYNKIKKKYLDNKNYVLKMISDSDFHFIHPLDGINAVDQTSETE